MEIQKQIRPPESLIVVRVKHREAGGPVGAEVILRSSPDVTEDIEILGDYIYSVVQFALDMADNSELVDNIENLLADLPSGQFAGFHPSNN